ncbi:MAG: hypothetical protein IH840_10955 [Candidatus Heimdallarchaeota archaeon]|nr:hypothetical protein [Candidatus Heimdallarchaeota archaeon]
MIKKDNLAPDFLAHALGVAAFGDLGLFEIFDTFREAEYLVVGTMESNFTINETLFLTDDRLGDAAAIANTLTGLDEVLEETVNNFFGGTNQIMPSEIFFLTKDDKRFLITLKGNDQRIVGTIAVTYFKDMDNWPDKDGELLKRRSLHMRTGQLLSSRTHTPFDASVERIYGDSISKNSKMMKVDHAILSFNE